MLPVTASPATFNHVECSNSVLLGHQAFHAPSVPHVACLAAQAVYVATALNWQMVCGCIAASAPTPGTFDPVRYNQTYAAEFAKVKQQALPLAAGFKVGGDSLQWCVVVAAFEGSQCSKRPAKGPKVAGQWQRDTKAAVWACTWGVHQQFEQCKQHSMYRLITDAALDAVLPFCCVRSPCLMLMTTWACLHTGPATPQAHHSSATAASNSPCTHLHMSCPCLEST